MNSDVTVREVANREFVGVSESDDLLETVELLLAEDADTALVLRGSDPVGVVTDRDVLSLLVGDEDVETAAVEDAMRSTVPTIESEATVEEAADRMSAEGTRRLVVTDGDDTVGTLTEHDLFAARPLSSNEPGAGPEAPQAHPVGEAETALAADAGAEVGEGDEQFEDQSICEGCGTLTSDLVSFNGQLLCSDCRDI